MLLQLDNVILSSDLLTEEFCCDFDACGGACCVEGDAGAPVTLEEIDELEAVLDDVWPLLSASAQAVIDKQGVACTDPEGDLVTSIVHGKDCVFTCHDAEGRTLCATECLFRKGQTRWSKPISCALYPIREKSLGTVPAEDDPTRRETLIGLNYHRWTVCEAARKKGRELHLPLYRFLREPLIRRFGAAWYEKLGKMAETINNNTINNP